MSKVIVTLQDDSTEEFTDTIGHQVGNGAVQIMNADGTQRIFNNFKEVFVDLDDEEKAAFTERMRVAEEGAQARIDAQEKAQIANPAPADIALDS